MLLGWLFAGLLLGLMVAPHSSKPVPDPKPYFGVHCDPKCNEESDLRWQSQHKGETLSKPDSWGNYTCDPICGPKVIRK